MADVLLFIPRIGPLEAVIILSVVLIVFGVGRLPEIGGAVGKAIREFRRETKNLEEDQAVKEQETTGSRRET